MSGAGFRYDASDWPVVRVTPPAGPLDDAALAGNFERLTAYLSRREPLVFIFELDSGTALSVQQREQIRKHEERQRELIATYQRGVGIVIRSAFQRAMIGALFWLIRTPSSTRVFADAESALSWARKLVAR